MNEQAGTCLSRHHVQSSKNKVLEIFRGQLFKRFDYNTMMPKLPEGDSKMVFFWTEIIRKTYMFKKSIFFNFHSAEKPKRRHFFKYAKGHYCQNLSHLVS